MFLALLMFLFLLMNMFLVSFYPVPCHALPFRPERKDLSDLSHIHKSLNWWVHFIFHSCCCSVYSPWHLKPSSQMCRRSDNLFHFISFLHLIFSFPPCHLVSNTRNATSRIRGESLSRSELHAAMAIPARCCCWQSIDFNSFILQYAERFGFSFHSILIPFGFHGMLCYSPDSFAEAKCEVERKEFS